jgi:hypothetical protein
LSRSKVSQHKQLFYLVFMSKYQPLQPSLLISSKLG